MKKFCLHFVVSILSGPAITYARMGNLDPDFGDGDGMNSVMVSGHADGAWCLALQPDGKILKGGFAHSNITGGADMALVRINENGIPDFTFDGDVVRI